jgi:hypothetical protein
MYACPKLAMDSMEHLNPPVPLLKHTQIVLLISDKSSPYKSVIVEHDLLH